MRNRIILGISLLTLATFAQANSVCKQKEQAILKQIDYAKKYGNHYRVAGLERALSNVRTYCSDASVQAAHQQKIQQLEQKVAQREQELRREKAQGNNRKKIAKLEKKLAEAQEKLREAKSSPY
ncbi:DUF1090 domain-containing protein [Erwinia sorbitola]|uniref:DUF1090 family protein n=1 Tax=Erwinia sorbitola TaxID=2681984 RepID=A0A6I6F5A8_9GAMM|nr:DUF1090 domain-containing protein [Erwinia sorbitola]MTD27542.1 DUF1090 family protein [Erwinia sorbitola]QGU89080.1 DUF1090 family protein [Erwinia sorbitola]